jgi:thiol-disulfide isomerase/thioredoxin
VACAPPGAEQSGLDQTKCLQACTDLEDTGVRLFDSVLAIFTGERDISVVGRGLDRTDQALANQILAYIALGIDQMTGQGWDDLDIDTIIGAFWSVVESGPLVDRLGRTHQPKDLGLKSKTAIGVFFSGHWCPHSREFTPDLIDSYDHWARQKGFEILFCSSDQTEEEFRDYLGEMPWKAFPYEDPRIDHLSQMYAVSGIPSLVIVGPDGRVISEHGRERVSRDLYGSDFPWYPSARRQEECEEALSAHKMTPGAVLGSGGTGATTGAASGAGGGAAAAGVGGGQRTIQVRDRH